jgi:hypothetical protein
MRNARSRRRLAQIAAGVVVALAGSAAAAIIAGEGQSHPQPTTTTSTTSTITTTTVARGEGCTPGYWKQPHHFDSWVGFEPGDSFETVFGVNAFPGDPTLLEVLRQGGGGVKALGRHAVAALLNSAAGLDFGLTTGQVIARFGDAVAPGAPSIESVKNEFEELNEQGCPLN